MELTFNKSGSNWNSSMTPKKIFERQFNPSVFLLNEIKGKPLDQELLNALYSQYKCVFKFKDEGFNNNRIWCGRTLCWRGHRDGKVMYSEGVKLVEGEATMYGGSLKHPCPTFKDNICTLEFISDGIPTLDPFDGWKVIEVIKFERINNLK